jgi:uncharacterized lipoprotein YddW (UPF0748 family)
VQIRGRADAYYTEAIEPRPAALSEQPAFDPLATTLALAHAAGLQVHAWVNVNLVAGVNELPASRDHVIYRHPEWLMVPRALVADLQAVDPRSPGYLGRLARYVRRESAEVEGLYLSPISEGAADYTVGVVRTIVQRYPVDGVHFDYVRYPTDDFDYSREALSAFRRTVLADLSSADARRYESRLAGEPLVYTEAFADRWRAFRVARLSGLIRRLRDTVKTFRPDATVSAAVVPSAPDAAAHRFQDWPAWIGGGLIDVVCPMAYTTDSALFASQIASVSDVAGRHPIWAGIGAYRLSSGQIVDRVQAARRLGAAGVVLFSYDSLTAPPHGTDYLAQLARAAFTSPF